MFFEDTEMRTFHFEARKVTNNETNMWNQQRSTICEQDDFSLVGLARQGNRDAFGELARRHRQRCMARAVTLLRNLDDAEDEVQNALCKAFERIHQYRGEGDLSCWLTQIVTNECLMRMRTRRRTRYWHYLDADPGYKTARMEFPAFASDPEGELGYKQMRNALHVQLKRVPAAFRWPLFHYHIEGKSLQEVADELGITVAAAKARLTRGRKELRLRLKSHVAESNASQLSRAAAPFNRVAARRRSSQG